MTADDLRLYLCVLQGGGKFYVVAKDEAAARKAVESQWSAWGYSSREGKVIRTELLAEGGQYPEAPDAGVLGCDTWFIPQVSEGRNGPSPASAGAPAQEPEVYAGETYYDKGKNADYYENLTDKEFAWEATVAAQDLNDTAILTCGDPEHWMPIQAIISIAAQRIDRLVGSSAFEPDEAMVRALVAWVREDVLPAYGISGEASSDVELVEGAHAALRAALGGRHD